MSTPEDILNQINHTPYIQFDETTYKRTPILQTSEYEVILICWKAGQQTPIHDHPSIGCTLKVLKGCLLETDICPDTLQPLLQRELSASSIGFKQGSNPLHTLKALEDSISLHLYQPPRYVPRIFIKH
jgi:cysteine dioxygenase